MQGVYEVREPWKVREYDNGQGKSYQGIWTTGQLGKIFEIVTKIKQILILASKLVEYMGKIFSRAFGAPDLSDIFF